MALLQRCDAGRWASTSSGHAGVLGPAAQGRRRQGGRSAARAQAAVLAEPAVEAKDAGFCGETGVPPTAVEQAGQPHQRAGHHLQPCSGLTQAHAGLTMSRLPSLAASNGQRYHIHTMGCQMNLADSERMAGVLDAAGYQCTDEAGDADVVIYNTCSIRDKAEQKVYSALGRQVMRPYDGWALSLCCMHIQSWQS